LRHAGVCSRLRGLWECGSLVAPAFQAVHAPRPAHETSIARSVFRSLRAFDALRILTTLRLSTQPEASSCSVGVRRSAPEPSTCDSPASSGRLHAFQISFQASGTSFGEGSEIARRWPRAFAPVVRLSSASGLLSGWYHSTPSTARLLSCVVRLFSAVPLCSSGSGAAASWSGPERFVPTCLHFRCARHRPRLSSAALRLPGAATKLLRPRHIYNCSCGLRSQTGWIPTRDRSSARPGVGLGDFWHRRAPRLA
jgi:hypothetical protein